MWSVDRILVKDPNIILVSIQESDNRNHETSSLVKGSTVYKVLRVCGKKP